MTTRPRTSGDLREDAAIAAGRQARAVLDAAETAILALLAGYLRQVAAGSLTAPVASRRARMAVVARLGAAMRKLTPLLAPLPAQAQQSVRAAVLRAADSAMAAFAAALAAGARTGFPGAVRSQFAGVAAQMAAAQQQAQQVMDGLAERGLTAFTDVSGRDWDLAVYAAMTIRSATSQALLDRDVATIGTERVLIGGPAGAATCKLCKPYAGHILTLAEMDQATTEGLYHRNCRHFPIPYEAGMDTSQYLTTTMRAGNYADQQEARRRGREALMARRRAAAGIRFGPRRRVA